MKIGASTCNISEGMGSVRREFLLGRRKLNIGAFHLLKLQIYWTAIANIWCCKMRDKTIYKNRKRECYTSIILRVKVTPRLPTSTFRSNNENLISTHRAFSPLEKCAHLTHRLSRNEHSRIFSYLATSTSCKYVTKQVNQVTLPTAVLLRPATINDSASKEPRWKTPTSICQNNVRIWGSKSGFAQLNK